MCSMTITILLSRRIIRSVPLLKGKKAEAPSLPDDPPIGLHTVSCNCPSFNRPTIRSPIRKKKKKKKSVLYRRSKRTWKKIRRCPPRVYTRYKTLWRWRQMYIGEKLLIRGRIVKICWLLNHFSLLKNSPVIFNVIYFSFFQRNNDDRN